jgi:hypothetical protein
LDSFLFGLRNYDHKLVLMSLLRFKLQASLLPQAYNSRAADRRRRPWGQANLADESAISAFQVGHKEFAPLERNFDVLPRDTLIWNIKIAIATANNKGESGNELVFFRGRRRRFQDFKP